MTEYVIGYAFDDLNCVALILKTHPPHLLNKWIGIGGAVEEGETIFEAMTREFYEESGVYVPTSKWDLVGLIIKEDLTKIHVFTTTSKSIRQVKSMTNEVVRTFTGWSIPPNCADNVPASISLCSIVRNRPHFLIDYSLNALGSTQNVSSGSP